MNCRRHRLTLVGSLVAFAAVFASGCGSETATVTGRVTYQGRPVTNGSVIVYCSDKQIVRGNIGPDGAYTIPNVPRGTLAVTVQTHARIPAGLKMQQNLPPSSGGPVPPTAPADDTTRVFVPARYALPEESGLSVVVDRGPVTYDINLKP